MSERCTLCYRRLRSDESQLAHEFSGYCGARETVTEERVVASWSEQTRLDVAADARRRRGENPHPTRTINREAPEHGTRSRYISPKWKCRCSLCRRAMADYAREKKANDPGYRERQRAAQRLSMQRRRGAS